MKKLIFMLTAVIFIFTACQKEEATLDTSAAYESGFHKFTPGDCATTFTTPMIADGGEHDEYCTGTEVGTITVEITDDGNGTCTFYVAYDITDTDWVIDATHLYIGPEADIPASGKPGSGKRNPKIGNFEFNTTYDPAVTSVPAISKNVPCVDENGDDITYVIAAHADVSGNFDDSEDFDFCASLPETATIKVKLNKPVSYFEVTVTEAAWLNGAYPGWCIDAYHGISTGPTYPFSGVYCMDEAGHFVDNHENLHLVNWVLNQKYLEQTSGNCDEDDDGNDYFTYADIQYAIWTLVDEYQPSGSGQFGDLYNPCRIAEIVADAEEYALTHDDPYEPGCGDIAIVIFDPGENANTDVQKIIIELPLTCQEETAWGYGYCAECGEDGYCDDGTWSDGPVATGISFTDSKEYYGGNAWGWYFYGCQESQD